MPMNSQILISTIELENQGHTYEIVFLSYMYVIFPKEQSMNVPQTYMLTSIPPEVISREIRLGMNAFLNILNQIIFWYILGYWFEK